MCWEIDYKLFAEQKKAQEIRIEQERRAGVIDQLLNDGAQKFLGDDVNDLGTHLIEDSLNDSLDKRWIRRHGRRWVRRCGWAEGCP